MQKKNLRILYICTVTLSRNGIVTWIINYSIKMKKKYPNYTIDVIVPCIMDNSICDLFEKNNIGIIEIPNRKNNPIKYGKNLYKLIKKNKYDLVHIHGNSTLMTVELFITLCAGIRIRIVHAHSTATSHPFLHDFLFPLFSRLYTCAFACNEAAGKWLFKNDKFYVIKNGIDFDLFKKNDETVIKMKNRYECEDSIVLGHIGQFDTNKNQSFLVNLIKELLNYNNFKLLLIGEGDNKLNIEKQVENHNLSDNVIFTGLVNNIYEVLQAVDIFVMPSHFEGLPFALIEAQALNIPCIVSNNISNEAKLSNLYFSLSLDNVQDWVNTVLSLIDNKNKVKHNESLSILDGFNLNQNLEKIVQIYNDLIKVKSGKELFDE